VELYLYSPSTPSWRGAQLKKAEGQLYLYLTAKRRIDDYREKKVNSLEQNGRQTPAKTCYLVKTEKIWRYREIERRNRLGLNPWRAGEGESVSHIDKQFSLIVP
jgi:hypothetical protein